MQTHLTLVAFLTLSLLSCNNRETKNNSENIHPVKNIEIKNTTKELISKGNKLIVDTIRRFPVDDYSVTYEMMAEQKADNQSSFSKTSGKTQSIDKAWFTNDTLGQTLIFELYTDGHRLATYHFYNSEIPTKLLDRLGLYTLEGDIASYQQKKNDFKGFLNQSVKINSKYFTTDKGLRLGTNKQNILNIYGKPDKVTTDKGIEILEWHFVGDILYDGKEDLNGKPLAKDNYGHEAYLFLKNGNLIGQILYNHIP